MAKPEWMNQSFAKSSPKTQSKQINGVKDCGSLFHKQKVAHYADGSEGGVFESIGNFFKDNFSSEAQAKRDEKATNEAIASANNRGPGDGSFWDRIRAGNIDDPRSEAYYRWGAGKDKAAEVKAKDDAEFAAIDKQFADAKAPKQATTTASSTGKKDLGEFEGVDEAIEKQKNAPPPAEKPAKQSFGQAFKSAKDGSTFEWNGKQYKKEYATESSSPSTAKSDSPKSSASNESVQKLSEQISDLNRRIDDPKVSATDKKNFEYAREVLRKQMVANASRTK